MTEEFTYKVEGALTTQTAAENGAVALLQFKGADGGTTITDEIGNTWLAAGSAALDTDEYYFPAVGSSLRLPGEGSYIYTADDDKWTLGTTNTIEARLKFSALPASGTPAVIFGQLNDANNYTALGISDAGVLSFTQIVGGTTQINISATATIGTADFTHLAMVKNGSVYSFYQDRALLLSGTSATAIVNIAGSVYVGAISPLGVYAIDGWLQEFRFSNVARTFDTNPPTMPYPVTYPVWTDITEDVRNSTIDLARGIPGVEVGDRVADVGTLDFVLDNSAGNSGTALGYYSPDHTDARTGFDIGMKTRLSITYGGTTYYKFFGKISDVTPAFGEFRERTTSCQAVDFMDELLSHNMELVAVQTGKTSDQLLWTIVNNLPNPPLEASFVTGEYTFPYALHDIQDESSNAMAAAQKVDNSGLSYTFVKGDLIGGECLTHQSKNTRASSTSAATFDNTMTDLKIGRTAARIYPTIKAKGHPAQVGSSAEILWTSRKEITLAAGGSITFDIAYVDPGGSGNRVALVPETGVTPEADTDYKMSSVSGDVGNDLNADLTYTVNTWGGNTANVTLTNGAAQTGYIGLLKLRGMIIRLNDPVTVTKTDATSKTTHGNRTLTHDLNYQDSVNVVEAFATTLLSQKKDPHSDIDYIEFIANSSPELMAAALALDVGSRITLIETATGIESAFFVNRYTLKIDGKMLICRLEALARFDDNGTIGYWGPGDNDSTYWGAGTATIGNWVF